MLIEDDEEFNEVDDNTLRRNMDDEDTNTLFPRKHRFIIVERSIFFFLSERGKILLCEIIYYLF